MGEKSKALTFEEIYEAYAERVLNLAYRFTSDEELSRDLTQDIFIKVYENLGRFEARSDIYTWIHRIAVNHILNSMKRKNRFKWLNARPAGSISNRSPRCLKAPILRVCPG